MELNGPIIITVHGTNDADVRAEGTRWWQVGSAFSVRLAWELAARGVHGAVTRPVRWSGANSDFDRLQGAEAVARAIKQAEEEQRPYAVIGHSHGGNVIMEALPRVGNAPRLGAVATFGTPFFTRSLKLVPALIGAFQVVLGILTVPTMIWALMLSLGADTNKKLEAIVVFGGLAALGIWAARAGLRRLTYRQRARRRLGGLLSPESWLVVHSPRDEAMRLLETAQSISPRYVTTASATRALTALGSLAGVVVTAALFAWNWRYFLDPVIVKLSRGEYGLGTLADLTFVLLMPVVYGAVAATVFVLTRIGGGWAWAKFLSRAIHGGVIGAAYGGDARYKLTGVTRLPPYLDGVLEERIEAIHLGGIDDAAVFNAARQLYDGVVANDTPDGGIGDPDIMWKRLSDALYHNAYMRDEQVVARVADHIAAGLGKVPGIPEGPAWSGNR